MREQFYGTEYRCPASLTAVRNRSESRRVGGIQSTCLKKVQHTTSLSTRIAHSGNFVRFLRSGRFSSQLAEFDQIRWDSRSWLSNFLLGMMDRLCYHPDLNA